MGRHSLLTDKDKQYIMLSLSTTTILDMASELCVDYETARLFLAKRGLKAVKKSIKINTTKRPPAQYSNTDHAKSYL